MIKVFNATDKNYATHGDLILQPSKAVVHKEDNGEFYLDLETPLNEKEYKNTTPEAGQTAEGTSFSITADLTKQYQVQTLKGQTTQSGTPTPSSPVPINITTGRQVVNVCEKNLFNPNNITSGLFYNTSNGSETSSSVWSQSSFIGVNGGTKISISSNYSVANNSYEISQFNENKQWLQGEQFSLDTAKTYTLNANAKYIRIGFRSDRDTTDKLQIEKNDQPTTYEEYKGNDYEINLGKNLFDIDGITTGGTLDKYNNGFTLIKGTNRTIRFDLPMTLKAGTYTLGFDVINLVKTQTNYFLMNVQYGSNNTNVVSSVILNNTGATFTATSDFNKLYFFINGNEDASATITIDNIQLEKGSVASSFSPYKTPIYLGKIGTYQDYIFRNTTENPLYDSNLEEGQWYIHKEIGRYTFTGSENWTTLPYGTNGWYVSSLINDALFIDTIATIKSNLFIGISNSERASSSYTNKIYIDQFKNIDLRDTTLTTKAQVQSTTKGNDIYYVLNTPTTTLIEDEELINQLNSIELLEELNNVSVSSANLAGILQLKYNFTTAYSNTIKYIDYLVPNNILVANTPQGDQAFRITNIEKTRRKIKLKANHVFYDTMNYLIADSYVVDKNCNDALDHLNNATSDLSPFTTISNITSINSYRCVRKSLYEAIQVVLERWGGHLVRNDWTLGIYDTIGQDNGVTIRYAKNLKDISATYDWQDVVTKLLPVGKDGILLNEIDPDASIYVESATQYDIPYTKTVSFEQNDIVEDNYKDEEGILDEDTYKQALIDDLYSKAIEYVTNNYLPKVNYKLNANVEKVSDVGDRVEVIDEKLGINLMTNIISFEYDCILERYTQIEFGNFKPTLSNLMTQITVNTEEQITANNQTLQITLNQELETATDKIWDALGNSYVIYEGDKILVVDTLPKENATNVIMINNGGIAFSNTGINGTFSSAWTIDNVLNMEQINVINLTADLIKGGTLKLGSNLNQNGKIEVFDEANTLIAELNKNGLKMYGADGSYVLMNNTVGFAGYDKNNTPIYWVSKDEFHMKKAAAEEEITLVGKVRIIPITIRDGNNNIVNDGIGFVNVGGGV